MGAARELAELATAYNTGNELSFRNKLINGDMRIYQRAASATPAGGEVLAVDRWAGNSTGTTRFSMQQSSVAPPGFTQSLLITTTTSNTPGSGDFCYFVQHIEGLNCADLAYGTASAQPITLSFWVRSSLTGTFGGALGNHNGTRRYVFSYTINSANAWEYKTVTIPGDTTGSWLTDNGRGISVIFDLGSGSSNKSTAGIWGSAGIAPTGSVNLVATNGATIHITGAQFEAGRAATPFELRNFQSELAMCQRYFVDLASTSDSVNPYRTVCFGTLYNTTSGSYTAQVPVRMRSLPSFSQTGGMYGYFGSSGSIITVSSFAGPYSMGGTIIEGDFTLSSSGVQGQTSMLKYNNTSTQRFAFSAEL